MRPRVTIPFWRLRVGPHQELNVLHPVYAAGIATIVAVADTAYFVFLGRLAVARTLKHVACQVRSGGAGAQTAELGFFATGGPPDKAGLSFTKLAATGTIGDLTAAGVVRNTSAFNTAAAAGTYLWAGVRTAMATTQPTFVGLLYDMGGGLLQATATAGALTGSGPWTGALIASGVTGQAPALYGELAD